MRFTKNLRTSDYKQLNGQRFTVSGFTPDGQITLLTEGKTLDVPPSQLLHSDYRYVDTVHSSQGQTADYCIYSASPANSLIIGRESFYVAASRARQEFVVYTASAQDLGVTIQQSRANENALDLMHSSLHKEEKHLLYRAPREAEEQKEPEKFAPHSPATSAQKDSVLEKASSNPLFQLSDAELLSCVRSVNQWQKNCPTEPSMELFESYQKRIDSLNQQKANLEKKLSSIVEELKQLGNPRSLFNPFGVKTEIIEEKQDSLLSTRMALGNVELQLDRAKTDLTLWQRKARTYLTWHENSHTKKMKELADFLNSPPIIERLQRLEQGYSIHQAARYILDSEGIQTGNDRYAIGNNYRISLVGETISIFHTDRSEPLYQATERAGILALSHFNMTPFDKKVIEAYAQYLQQTHEPKLDKGPQLGR
jgi:hypothetical protein